MTHRPEITTTTNYIFSDDHPVGLYYAPLDTWLLSGRNSGILCVHTVLPERYTWLTPSEFKLALKGKAHEVFVRRFVEKSTGGNLQP